MGRGDERDDAALLGAVANEPEAFAAFYDRYAEAVFAFLLTRTRRRDLAADLTAETFAAALAAASRYRGSAPTAAPWLFGIARNGGGVALAAPMERPNSKTSPILLQPPLRLSSLRD